MQLTDNIQNIKGIGEKTAQLFGKLGIVTVRDLIFDFPRTYKEYSEPVPILDISEEGRVAVFCRVVSNIAIRKGRRVSISTFSVSDSTSSMQIVFFNSPYIRSVFRKGESYIFVGEVKRRGAQRVMEMPEYFTQFNYQKALRTMQPVYGLTQGLSNHTIQKSIEKVEECIRAVPEYLPDEVVAKYQLLPLREALYRIHFPREKEELVAAIKRLSFEEFLRFLINIRKMKEEREVYVNSHVATAEAKAKLDGFIAGLPFSLTEGQLDAVSDMVSDMTSDHVMSRLLQGDVGSGKTIVAASAMFLMAVSGFQSAVMVPTEVLASQHYEDLKKLFKPYKVEVCLLTGSMSIKEKREVYEKLKDGTCQIVVGTHALIQEKVEFHSLGLVVADEQHRFGVRQREKLVAKGEHPHSLFMSATPIPRTLAIMIYADMDISLIKTMPGGRKKIKNCVVGTEYRPAAYQFIRDEVANGHQAYVICPMIEESETMDAENVISYAEMLSDTLGSRIRVSVLHGKMSETEKNDIILRFAAREIDVLVSTTVVEVGINNPNATVMMVENAERFGLAQLHQLRGRVGRGDAQSYCVFINVKQSEESKERLKILNESNSGFDIAEYDLRLRGPGEFFGVKQSGDLNFHIADIYQSADMLKAAQEVSLMPGIAEKVEGGN